MQPMRHARLGLPGWLFLVTVVLWSDLARAETAPTARRPPRRPTPPVGGDPARAAGRARAADATGRRAHGDAAAGPAAHPRAAAGACDLDSAPPLTLTPEPAPAPPLELDRRTAQPPSERPVPFYRKNWFWGTVGLVVLTTAIIVVSTSTMSSSSPPMTTLGNMHAF